MVAGVTVRDDEKLAHCGVKPEVESAYDAEGIQRENQHMR